MLHVIASAVLIGSNPALDERSGFAVIAPRAWATALAPFLEARKREFAVEFVALEDALAAKDGVDAPEKIKRELFRRYQTKQLRYALLVGDADVMPVRFMVLDRGTEAAFNYAFYASDLYYADLADEHGAFDDWNGAKDGFHARYFGEVRGETNKHDSINYDHVSYTPEIAVGRWPVSNEHELADVVKKTLEWKPSSDSLRALVLHSAGWVDARDRVGADADALAANGFEVAREFYGSPETAPNPERVEKALLAGVDLALHVGHGSEETWDQCLGPRERDALGAAHAGVFVSIGCSTGHFCNEPPYQPYLDERGAAHIGTIAGEVFTAPPPPPAALQTGAYNSTGLGERLLRMPKGGAIAYIGCNTGAQPCALSLLDGFTAALARGERRVGDAWRSALAEYVGREHLNELAPNDDWYPPSIFFQGMKFMLYGDPTLELRVATAAH